MIKVDREVIKKACEALHKVKGDMTLFQMFFRNTERIEQRIEAVFGGFLAVISNEGTLIIPAFPKNLHTYA